MTQHQFHLGSAVNPCPHSLPSVRWKNVLIAGSEDEVKEGEILNPGFAAAQLHAVSNDIPPLAAKTAIMETIADRAARIVQA